MGKGFSGTCWSIAACLCCGKNNRVPLHAGWRGASARAGVARCVWSAVDDRGPSWSRGGGGGGGPDDTVIEDSDRWGKGKPLDPSAGKVW